MQDMSLYAAGQAMTDGAHLEVDGLEAPESAFDLREPLLHIQVHLGNLSSHWATSAQPQDHLLTFGRSPNGDRLSPRTPVLEPSQVFISKPAPPLEPGTDRGAESQAWRYSRRPLSCDRR